MEQQPPAYYYADAAGRQAGPTTLGTILDLIVDGELAETTLVWWDGLADWIPLSSNDVLADALHRRRAERNDAGRVDEPHPTELLDEVAAPYPAGDSPGTDSPGTDSPGTPRGDAPNFQALVDDEASNADSSSTFDEPRSFWSAPDEGEPEITPDRPAWSALPPEPTAFEPDDAQPSQEAPSPYDPGDRPAWAMPAIVADEAAEPAPAHEPPDPAPAHEPPDPAPAHEPPDPAPAHEPPDPAPAHEPPDPAPDAGGSPGDSYLGDRDAFAALVGRTAGLAAERAQRRHLYATLVRVIDDELNELGWFPAATGRWVRGSETLTLTTSLLGADWPPGSPAVAELVVSHSSSPRAQSLLWPLDADEDEHRSAIRGAVDLLGSD